MIKFSLRKFLLLIFLPAAFCMTAGNSFGQDPHFSQYSYTPLQINPAYTGVFDGLARLSNTFRSQWSGIGKGFQTIHFSADAPVGKATMKHQFFGIGALIYQDKAGSAGFKSTILEGSLSFVTALDDGSDNFLAVGFQGGLNSQSIDVSKTTWDSQWNGDSFDPASGPGESIQLPSLNYLDMNAGLLYYYVPDGSSSFNIGGALQHIGSPNVSFFANDETPLRQKITIHSSAEIEVAKDYTWILPRVLYLTQGNQQELLIGASFKNKVRFKSRYTNYMKEAYFYGGLSYRFKDSYIINARFEYNTVGLGISYDINASTLSNLAGSANAFEVNFTYVTYVKRGTRSKNYNKMPRFF
jgi:type IX secretion system PorP/SprF family membrane protein